MREKFKPIRFPQDELAHDHIVEWWYWNGRLKGADGRDYAFMSCLFRTDIKKVKVPFLAKAPVKTLYFYHAILSDLTRGKWASLIELPTVISNDSFSKPLLFVNHASPSRRNGYVNCAMEETEKFAYLLRDQNIDLKLVSAKPPLLEGGKGFLDLQTKQTYYYSLTNLKTSGRIKVDGKWVDVSGKSWMDHQWANAAYSRDKWSWFSIQLDNETELVCCEYEDRGAKTLLADISYPDGRQEHCADLELAPLGPVWTSKKTRARYPSAWSIKVPSKRIDLLTMAIIKEQEMVFGPINYWEGPVDVNGRFGEASVHGSGFMELAGYPSKYTNARAASEEFENKMQGLLKNFKKSFSK